MSVYLTSGSWISSSGYGRLHDNEIGVAEPESGLPVLPPLENMLTNLPGRYGRFDFYTQLGFAAISLAAMGAGFDAPDKKQDVGIVVSGRFECLLVDMEYYQTTLEMDGALTSPNMFSYTLPGIVLGEAAAFYKLTGPTLWVGDKDQTGLPALNTAGLLLETGMCDAVVAGWLDATPESDAANGARQGAALAALSKTPGERSVVELSFKDGRLFIEQDSTPVESVVELLNRLNQKV